MTALLPHRPEIDLVDVGRLRLEAQRLRGLADGLREAEAGWQEVPRETWSGFAATTESLRSAVLRSALRAQADRLLRGSQALRSLADSLGLAQEARAGAARAAERALLAGRRADREQQLADTLGPTLASPVPTPAQTEAAAAAARRAGAARLEQADAERAARRDDEVASSLADAAHRAVAGAFEELALQAAGLREEWEPELLASTHVPAGVLGPRNFYWWSDAPPHLQAQGLQLLTLGDEEHHVEGPDGRLYRVDTTALVDPEGRAYLPSAEVRAEADPGWAAVGFAAGTGSWHTKLHPVLKVMASTLVPQAAAPDSVGLPDGADVEPVLLDALGLSPDVALAATGGAGLARQSGPVGDGPDMPADRRRAAADGSGRAGDRPGTSTEPGARRRTAGPSSRAGAAWAGEQVRGGGTGSTSTVDIQNHGRAHAVGVGAGALGLALDGLGAWSVLSQNGQRVWFAVFEEHERGERRVRLVGARLLQGRNDAEPRVVLDVPESSHGNMFGRDVAVLDGVSRTPDGTPVELQPPEDTGDVERLRERE